MAGKTVLTRANLSAIEMSIVHIIKRCTNALFTLLYLRGKRFQRRLQHGRVSANFGGDRSPAADSLALRTRLRRAIADIGRRRRRRAGGTGQDSVSARPAMTYRTRDQQALAAASPENDHVTAARRNRRDDTASEHLVLSSIDTSAVVYLNPVYTIQPVVKPVVQPV